MIQSLKKPFIKYHLLWSFQLKSMNLVTFLFTIECLIIKYLYPEVLVRLSYLKFQHLPLLFICRSPTKIVLINSGIICIFSTYKKQLYSVPLCSFMFKAECNSYSRQSILFKYDLMTSGSSVKFLSVRISFLSVSSKIRRSSVDDDRCFLVPIP